MSGLIEAKPVAGGAIRQPLGGGDQASALRALVEDRGLPRAIRRGPAADAAAGSVLRIAWLVEREYPAQRASITGIAAGIGQREGVRVAWDNGRGIAGGDGQTAGLLIVCDSCASVAEALRRVRRAVAGEPLAATRTAASSAWIGVMGLAGDAITARLLSASLRGLCDAVDQLMDEPTQSLGVERVAHHRLLGIWRPPAPALSDERSQRIEKFLCSRARSACAIR